MDIYISLYWLLHSNFVIALGNFVYFIYSQESSLLKEANLYNKPFLNFVIPSGKFFHKKNLQFAFSFFFFSFCFFFARQFFIFIIYKKANNEYSDSSFHLRPVVTKPSFRLLIVLLYHSSFSCKKGNAFFTAICSA